MSVPSDGRDDPVLQTFPRPVRGWMFVGVLVAAYAVSFVDRQILGLLVVDLRRDLAIGDYEIGLLQGPAFGLFYALMGLPFGWMADRVSRTKLIAAGLACWTLMTLLGGLTHSFGPLFVTRMGVGVGEAALVPAAISLLADCFAPNQRALPLSVFTAGASAGAGLALIMGGALIAFAHAGIAGLPIVGGWMVALSLWQSVLIMAGALGIPLAILIACLPEPDRRQTIGLAIAHDADGIFAYVGAHRALFFRMLAGSSSFYLFTNALSAWMPTLFIRTFGWTAAMVGARLGALVLVGATAGTLLSGVIATALVGRGRIDGPLRTMVGGAGLLVPFAILGPLVPDPALAQIAILGIYFAIALCFGCATASFVAVTPPALRGRMVALYLLLGNLVGLGLGPPAVGFVLQWVVVDPARVGAALALVSAPAVLLGAVLLATALHPHARLAAILSRL